MGIMRRWNCSVDPEFGTRYSAANTPSKHSFLRSGISELVGLGESKGQEAWFCQFSGEQACFSYQVTGVQEHRQSGIFV